MKITGGRSAAAVVFVAAATMLAGCHSNTAGPSIAEHPPVPNQATTAASLLLADGAQMPLGKVTAAAIHPGYITSVDPSECAAAMLFKGSPLPPADSNGYAESAYGFEASPALYAELVNVYDRALDVDAVIDGAKAAVAACTGEATGHSPAGPSAAQRVAGLTESSPGVLVWRMGAPGWGCNYGMAVIPSAVLMLSECEPNPGFDMAGWAKTRRAQLDKSSA